MGNDMSDMMKNLNSVLNGNQIPDNVKDMLSSLIQNSKNSTSNNNSSSVDSDQPTNNSADSEQSNIDINTILKMQELIKSMQSETNSSRSNLLRSLKPYLKPSRQEKVDQYIQLFNMEKVFKMLNNNGNS